MTRLDRNSIEYPVDRFNMPSEQRVKTRHRVKFEAVTASSLAATRDHTTYIVEDILVDGQPGIVAGPRKTLKTSFVVDLALRVSMAGEFLGHFVQ